MEAPDPAFQPARRSSRVTRETIHFTFFAVRVSLDFAMILLGFLISYWLRSKIPFGGEFIPIPAQHQAPTLILSCGAVLLAFYSRGLYRLKRGYSKVDEFYRTCSGVLFGLIAAIALNSLALGSDFIYSRQILMYSLVVIIGLVTLARLLFGSFVGFLRRQGLAQIRLVIVGTGETPRRILRKVSEAPELGYHVLGVVCEEPRDSGKPCIWVSPPGPKEWPLLGHINELGGIIGNLLVDEVIVAMGPASQEQLLDVVSLCDNHPVSVKIYPDAFQLITTNEVAISELTGLPLINVKNVALQGVNRVIKRTLDLFFSGLILIFSSPIMLLIALMIKITDPGGPVFYIQERVGLDGKPFKIIKFRSMKINSEIKGPAWTTKRDPRRTLLGAIIRRFSIDEIPQFINVLMGDMSIVGPRPEQPHFVEQFSQTIPRYMLRHKEKAGITGWAQVNGLRGDTSISERTRYDLYYIENWSVLFDLKIMLKSVIVIFTDHNAY